MQEYLYTPPFDALAPTERAALANSSAIVYLEADCPLPQEWRADFFVVLKGKIKETMRGEIVAGLNDGDWFDARSDGTFTPSEQTLLLRIDGAALLGVSRQNPTLQKLLFEDLSARIAEQQTRQAKRVGQNLLHSRVGELFEYIRKPVFVDESASVFDAARAMTQAGAKHVLVQKTTGEVGMFTQADLCRAAFERADFAKTKAKQYSSFALQTVDVDEDVSDALLTMLDCKIHRLPVVQNKKIVGVLGQSDLLGFLAHHSELIVHRVGQATNLNDLARAVEGIGQFIRAQHNNGAKIHVIGRMVQNLNAQVFCRVWQLVAPTDLQKNSCVVVMGSEGRGEQIMRTDQDNALIVKDGYQNADLPRWAQAFNDALSDLGYPNCQGGIMMKNAQWRLPLSDFCAQVDAWIDRATGDDMLQLAALIDACAVCGDVDLLERLRAHWLRSAQQAPSGFINRFAKAAVDMNDGHRFWQKFTGAAHADIDLKKAGIFPIVHGVRALALENGLLEISTKARLQALAQKGVLDGDTAQNLSEALAFFLSKRLAAALEQPDRGAWRVNPNRLSALDKDLLKQSLAIVKAFKAFLVRHYRLDVF